MGMLNSMWIVWNNRFEDKNNETLVVQYIRPRASELAEKGRKTNFSAVKWLRNILGLSQKNEEEEGSSNQEEALCKRCERIQQRMLTLFNQ